MKSINSLDCKEYSNIEEHEVLKGFSFKIKKPTDPSEIGEVSIISPEGNVLKPIEINLQVVDSIIDSYEEEKINYTKIVEEIKKYEEDRKGLNLLLHNLGYRWVSGKYNSIHGTKTVNTLIPKLLDLDLKKDYCMDSKLSLSKEEVNYLGTFGSKSVFISPGTNFSEIPMSGFLEGVFIMAISKEGTVYTADVLSGGTGCSMNIYEYKGSLLFHKTTKSFQIGQHDNLSVLVDSKGVLQKDLFGLGEVAVSETVDTVERKKVELMGVLK